MFSKDLRKRGREEDREGRRKTGRKEIKDIKTRSKHK